MKENGSPPPEFRTDDDHSFFATVLPIHHEARAAVDDLRGNLRGGNPQVDTVVAALLGEMTRQALQDALGLADREYFRKAYLLPVLEAGLVEMTHPDKPNSRNQRYRLTSAGKDLRTQNEEGVTAPTNETPKRSRPRRRK